MDARHKAGRDAACDAPQRIPLTPADAGIQPLPRGLKRWVPASAGTSG